MWVDSSATGRLIAMPRYRITTLLWLTVWVAVTALLWRSVVAPNVADVRWSGGYLTFEMARDYARAKAKARHGDRPVIAQPEIDERNFEAFYGPPIMFTDIYKTFPWYVYIPVGLALGVVLLGLSAVVTVATRWIRCTPTAHFRLLP